VRDIARPAYLPIDRRHALVVGESLPPRAHGAALFADIAGFTRLSRELSETYGARGGVDLLSEVLEAVYAVVVAEIHDHGGTVIGFSGDAVTC
jgi:class 3 adenylate cyclase